MTALGDALEALEAVVGTYLDGWHGYQGFALEVKPPAFIVGVPTEVSYAAGPQDRARYTVPLTGCVDVERPLDLVDFLTGDGLPATLSGATAAGWWGGLSVDRAEATRTAPNGAEVVLVSDLIVTFYA